MNEKIASALKRVREGIRETVGLERNCTIAVLTVLIGDDPYKQLLNPCIESIKSYCKLHHLELIVRDTPFYHDRPPAWTRIGLIKELFQTRSDISHILYLDADVMITNSKFSIEPLVEILEKEKKSILFSIDGENNLNDGVALYKNSKDTVRILETVERYIEYTNHPWWENAAFMRAYIDDFFSNSQIMKISNARLINSYIKGRCRWQFGDFIVHFAGLSNEDRAILIPAFYEFIKKIESKVPAVDFVRDHIGVGS